jgi:hypothetical protein
MEKNTKLTFEIEDYHGNTVMAFQVDVSDIDNPKVINEKDCTHADTDNDCIFESSGSLLRIQSSTLDTRELPCYKLRDADSKHWSEIFFTDAPEEEVEKTITYIKSLNGYNNEMIYNTLKAIGYEVVVHEPKREFYY